MLKTHEETQTTTVVVVDDILCNKCGQSIRMVPANGWLNPPFDWLRPNVNGMECVTIDKSWGFSSTRDMTRQYVNLCEPCWDDMCETFVIPPDVTDCYGDSFIEDDPQLSLFSDEDLFPDF